jgi:hypothetical protein
MNKLKLYVIALLAAGMGMTACSERFLDVEPMTQLLDNNFFSTVADVEMALIGCYDGYQATSADGNVTIPFYVASEVMSDNCFGGTGNADDRKYQVLDRFDIGEFPSESNLFNNAWSSYYAGIFRCNTLLGKLDGVDFSGEGETTRPRIEGETRFLRAILYFDLVRLFENIPLITTPTTDNVPQAAPAEVYRLIAADLKFAAENIPADAYPKANAKTNDGRATSYAAKAMLARVYLFYTGYYYQANDLGVTKADVLAGLEDVIESREFELVDDYKSLWPAASYKPVVADNTLDMSEYAGMGNKEAVFTQKFNSPKDPYNGDIDGNRWLVMMGLRQTDHSPYGKGWGACTVDPALFNAFDNADARKTASIIDIVGEGIKASFDKVGLDDQREYTGYATKKYTPTCLPDGTSNTGGTKSFQDSQDQDFVVIRYADVLLMAAELESPNAQAYFDEVRARAGLASSPVTVSKEAIMNERRFEFAFEGLRYWDLLRQGLDVAAAAIARTGALVKNGGVDGLVVISADDFKAKRGFVQIPATQITLSQSVLKQNQGW